MNYVWKRLSYSDVQRLIEKHDLNENEQKILKLLRKGKSHRAIANEIMYSIRTVEDYARRIYVKVKNDLWG